MSKERKVWILLLLTWGVSSFTLLLLWQQANSPRGVTLTQKRRINVMRLHTTETELCCGAMLHTAAYSCSAAVIVMCKSWMCTWGDGAFKGST